MNTLTLTWAEITSAWNASSDKRFNERLLLTESPCILHEDEYELPRYEYFEKEYGVIMEHMNGQYNLTFKTPQEVTFFVLRWL